MTTTVALNPLSTLAAESSVAVQRAHSTEARGVRHDTFPAAIPRSQLYYWTGRWQTDEQEAVRELRRGAGLRFDDAASAIRWLLSEDD